MQLSTKFDLINDRLPQWGRPHVTSEIPLTYGSPVPSTLDLSRQESVVPFRCSQERLVMSQPGDGAKVTYDTVIDNCGRFINTIGEGTTSNVFTFPKAKFSHGIEMKKRIDTASMRRVLDNTHEVPEQTILRRVEKGQVKGALWSTTARVSVIESPQSLGPGYYDVDKSYSGSFIGDSLKVYTFSQLPRADLYTGTSELIDMKKTKRSPQIWRRLRRLSEGNKKEFSNSHSQGSSSLKSKKSDDVQVEGSHPHTSIATNTGVSFSKTPRWANPVYKTEKYSKTTGLLLSPDFDKDEKKMHSAVKLNNSTPRLVVFEHVPLTAGVDLNLDCGPKSSFQKSVAESPVRLATAFRSKAPSGFHLLPPTSDSSVGPGSYPGAALPSITVRRPEKASPVFLIERPKFTVRPLSNDSSGELPTFADVHTKGPIFELEGRANSKPISQLTKKKITKIYPKYYHC